MTDPASPLPHDGLRIALCSVLKNDYGLLPQRKQAAIDDAVKLLQERKITVEQVNGFLTFWEESQPLGPSICATTPHLNQVLEFMTACIAWQEEQRQCAEEVEIELREIHSRREAYERLHPDLSDFSAGDIPEEVQDWWDQLLNEMRLSLQPVVFERWLEQIRLVEASERLLTILVPDEQRRQWLEQRFNDQLSQRLQRISDQDFQFQYLLPQQFENRQ